MKKLIIILMVFCIILLIPTIAFADVGPKPNIKIEAINMPDEICYMDLLVEVKTKDDTYEEFLTDEYDQEMISILSSYDVGGWSAAIVNREYIVFDDIRCKIDQGLCTMNFGYMPPDTFKIIVVTKSGEIRTSNVIETKAFDSTIDYDYDTGIASERSVVSEYLPNFFVTLFLTLLIEGSLFLAFRFGFKKYWGLVLGVNIVTQIVLHAAILFGMLTGGIFFAVILYILAEVVIIVGETIVYAFLLKTKPVLARVGYAITANLLSLFAGVIIFGIFS